MVRLTYDEFDTTHASMKALKFEHR